MKYYKEKSNIEEQPKTDGYYFTNYGRLQYRSGVPGLWYELSGMPCNSPIWYLEECVNDIPIWCGLCEEKVSLYDCLNKAGAIIRQMPIRIMGEHYRTGSEKIVCPGCVSQYGMEAALDMAKPFMDVLIDKAK